LVPFLECDVAYGEDSGVGLGVGLAFEQSAGFGAVGGCADDLLTVAAGEIVLTEVGAEREGVIILGVVDVVVVSLALEDLYGGIGRRVDEARRRLILVLIQGRVIGSKVDAFITDALERVRVEVHLHLVVLAACPIRYLPQTGLQQEDQLLIGYLRVNAHES